MSRCVVSGDSLLDTWGTASRATAFLVEKLPAEIWREKVPGVPGRTIRSLACHVHNSRCMWIKMLGGPAGVRVPRKVDRARATRAQLLTALGRSGRRVATLLQTCLDEGGKLPARPAWLNLPNDIAHLLAYLVAHEAHHRGQLCMASRQLGHRLPTAVTSGLWQWRHRAREARAGR